MRALRTSLRSISLCLALVAPPAGAVEIAYQAIDLADAVPGDDRWLYRYWIDDFPYDAGTGFTIHFAPALYALLEPGPAPSDWDVVVLDPDLALGADGLFDAQALVGAPPTLGTFSVSFVWLGDGTPGAQPFEVREPAPSFEAIETGDTVAPEPASLALASAAIASIAAARRSRS